MQTVARQAWGSSNAAAPRRRPVPHRRAQLRSLRPAAAAAGGAEGGEQPQQQEQQQEMAAVDTTYTRLDTVGQLEDGMDPAVQEALKKVQAALNEAEQNMQTLHTLPSARLPTAWDRALAALRPAAQVAALYSACAAVHSLGAVGRALGGLAIALGIGAWGWRRSSLSGSGAAAAVLVGWGTLASSFRSGLLLLTFFFASSKITQAGPQWEPLQRLLHARGGGVPVVACLGTAGAPISSAPSPTPPACVNLDHAINPLSFLACCSSAVWRGVEGGP